MKKSLAASALVAVSATVVWMGTAAFAASGFTGRPHISAGAAAQSVRAISANKCDNDHDSDDVSCGTNANKCDNDHDSDDVSCGTNANKCDHDHDSDDVSCGTNANDHDHDSDDVTPSRHCWTDRDRDDRTGHPSDRDGDVCGVG